MEDKLEILAIIKEAFAQASPGQLVGELIGALALFVILYSGLIAVLIWS